MGYAEKHKSQTIPHSKLPQRRKDKCSTNGIYNECSNVTQINIDVHIIPDTNQLKWQTQIKALKKRKEIFRIKHCDTGLYIGLSYKR